MIDSILVSVGYNLFRVCAPALILLLGECECECILRSWLHIWYQSILRTFVDGPHHYTYTARGSKTHSEWPTRDEDQHTIHRGTHTVLEYTRAPYTTRKKAVCPVCDQNRRLCVPVCVYLSKPLESHQMWLSSKWRKGIYQRNVRKCCFGVTLAPAEQHTSLKDYARYSNVVIVGSIPNESTIIILKRINGRFDGISVAFSFNNKVKKIPKYDKRICRLYLYVCVCGGSGPHPSSMLLNDDISEYFLLASSHVQSCILVGCLKPEFMS